MPRPYDGTLRQQGERFSLDISFSDFSTLGEVEVAWVSINHMNGDTARRSHVEIREGKLSLHGLSLADGSPWPLNYSAILAPGAYGLEIETETGHLFRGSFTVSGDAVPNEAGELAPIPVVVSLVRR